MRQERIARRRSEVGGLIALALALVLAVLLYVIAQGDYVASDPLWYAQLAKSIADDPAVALHGLSNHPFHMRIGLTLPLAALYRVLGFSQLVTGLPCLFAELLILVVIYAAAPTSRAKQIGIVVGLSAFGLLRHVVVLEVDLPCGALLAASVLCLARRDSGSRWLVGAMVLWFAAFLVKETALWSAPIWIFAAVSDGRAALRRYVPAALVGSLLGGAYLVLCAVVWGDPLARFAGIQALTNGHNWSMTGQGASAWAARLVWGPPLLFVSLAGAALLAALCSPWLVSGRERIWWIAAGVLMAMFWFGSTSVTAYAPLPLLTRMAVVALPPILVCATLAIDQLFDRRRALATVLLGAIVVSGVWFVGRFLARPRPETDAMAYVAATARDAPVLLVCGDPRCMSLATFMLGHAVPPNLTITFAPQLADGPRPHGAKVLFLVNLKRPADAEWWDPATDPRHYTVDKVLRLGLPPLIKSGTVRMLDAGDGARLWDALQ